MREIKTRIITALAIVVVSSGIGIIACGKSDVPNKVELSTEDIASNSEASVEPNNGSIVEIRSLSGVSLKEILDASEDSMNEINSINCEEDITTDYLNTATRRLEHTNYKVYLNKGEAIYICESSEMSVNGTVEASKNLETVGVNTGSDRKVYINDLNGSRRWEEAVNSDTESLLYDKGLDESNLTELSGIEMEKLEGVTLEENAEHYIISGETVLIDRGYGAKEVKIVLKINKESMLRSGLTYSVESKKNSILEFAQEIIYKYDYTHKEIKVPEVGSEYTNILEGTEETKEAEGTDGSGIEDLSKSVEGLKVKDAETKGFIFTADSYDMTLEPLSTSLVNAYKLQSGEKVIYSFIVRNSKNSSEYVYNCDLHDGVKIGLMVEEEWTGRFNE